MRARKSSAIGFGGFIFDVRHFCAAGCRHGAVAFLAMSAFRSGSLYARATGRSRQRAVAASAEAWNATAAAFASSTTRCLSCATTPRGSRNSLVSCEIRLVGYWNARRWLKDSGMYVWALGNSTYFVKEVYLDSDTKVCSWFEWRARSSDSQPGGWSWGVGGSGCQGCRLWSNTSHS